MNTKEQPFKKGYKFEIYPNIEQKELLENTFGCCRFVWNKALDNAKKEYEFFLAHKDLNPSNIILKPNLSGYEFVNRLIKYKSDPETQWLNDVNSVALQQTMLHLGTAFSIFFKNRKGYPAFKKKHNRQSFSLMTNSFRFKGEQLFIAKSKDPLIVGFSRKLPSQPSSATISKSPTGRYYISFICEYIPTKTNGKGKIGIDLGLKDFLVTSDGIKIPNPKHLKKHEKRLKRLQQSLSKKRKGSKSRNKARIKVAKQYEVVSNCRNDFQHKLSRILVNENQVIGLEKLIVKNMVKNRKLSKAISDVAWGSFTSKLNYKAKESQNCKLVYMDCWYPSSHICNVDHIQLDRKLSLSERTWKCPHCNTIHDRDINAAINIRNEAILTIELFQLQTKAGHVTFLANRPH
ncbi:MAG: hypothetical protein ACD_84C00014G0004 [uncultured bacterium]|nr:MAG: hypothetical protein ACD_84C00014G0004 [uncultured bacterium]